MSSRALLLALVLLVTAKAPTCLDDCDGGYLGLPHNQDCDITDPECLCTNDPDIYGMVCCAWFRCRDFDEAFTYIHDLCVDTTIIQSWDFRAVCTPSGAVPAPTALETSVEASTTTEVSSSTTAVETNSSVPTSGSRATTSAQAAATHSATKAEDSTSNNNSSSSSSNSKLPLALGIGLGVGIPLLLIGVGYIAFLVWRTKRQNRSPDGGEISLTNTEPVKREEPGEMDGTPRPRYELPSERQY